MFCRQNPFKLKIEHFFRWVVTSASCVFSDRQEILIRKTQCISFPRAFVSSVLCLTVIGLVVNRKVMKDDKLAVGFGEDGKQVFTSWCQFFSSKFKF